MNRDSKPHSLYVDGLSDSTKSSIEPNTISKITWDINDALGPGSADPACILKVTHLSACNTSTMSSVQTIN